MHTPHRRISGTTEWPNPGPATARTNRKGVRKLRRCAAVSGVRPQAPPLRGSVRVRVQAQNFGLIKAAKRPQSAPGRVGRRGARRWR
jgi:hypothetical protein